MRVTHGVLVVLGLASVALVRQPTVAQAASPQCDGSIRAGGFRLHLIGPDGQSRDALLVLERADRCLSALVIVDGGPPAALDSLGVDNGVLTARVSTADGEANVKLTLDEKQAEGTIQSRKSTWKVDGKRTA